MVDLRKKYEVKEKNSCYQIIQPPGVIDYDEIKVTRVDSVDAERVRNELFLSFRREGEAVVDIGVTGSAASSLGLIESLRDLLKEPSCLEQVIEKEIEGDK